MSGEIAATISIAAAIQIGTLIWFLSGVRSDQRNTIEWLTSIAKQVGATAIEQAELKGRVETLPCALCAPKVRQA